ncbi:TadE/TadG family type IV pilus assembly protein [Georgenia sp. M64]|uniref:TadE/TadG family type IV pilus assembly protein n=1 Tax=Georgenia sp. M64 TaxID=3120520 RepID=UPI0030E13797
MKIVHAEERGASAVEFALILPILLLLVVGIAEFGRAYNVQTVLADAARVGVRTMAIHSDVTQAKSAAVDVATSVSLTSNEVTVTPSTCEGTTDPATVTVTHDVDLIFFGEVEITGKATMRCNG